MQTDTHHIHQEPAAPGSGQTARPVRPLLTGMLLALLGLALLAGAAWAAPGAPAPAAQAEDPLQQGARLYAENCAVCHGSDGQGRVGATLAKDWPSIRPELTVKSIIQNGVDGSPMPAWSQAKGGPLSEAEIDALVQYILSWQHGGAPQLAPRPTATLGKPITPPPQVAGDPNRGAQLFDANCAVCHGPDGAGRIGATLAKDWSGIRPDLSVKQTISSGIEGSRMPAWGQANGGPLNEADVDDLTAFVLTLSDAGVVEVVQTTPGSVPGAAPGSASPLSGWAGVLLFVVLFALVIAAALRLQKQK
ncbi:MAG: c-type cytochrome [Chloroflexota bacterium]